MFISDDGDKAESESIGSQRDYQRFLKDKKDMVIGRNMSMTGIRGRNFERPGFKRR